MRERDLIVINLWLAVFIQVAAISAYSPFVPSMREELNFSFSEFGLLSTLFYLPYMMLQLFSGRASDRGQARTLLLIGIPILMILTMLLGAVENIAEALALRTVSGIFGAMIFVPALSVITKLDNKGLNTAIATLGTSVGAGSLYVSLLGPQLAVFLGWRLGIATMMLPGFAIWILNAKFIPKIRGGDFEKAASVPTRLSFKRKETWLLGYQQFVRIGVWLTVSIWLPTFFASALGYKTVLSGVSLTIFSVFAIISCVVGGHLANRVGSSSKVSTVSFFALSVVLALMAFANNGLLAFGLAGASGIFVFISFGPLFAIVTVLYQKEVVGLMMGFETMLANLGAVVVPFLFGYFTDLTGHFTLSWILIAALSFFAFATGLPVIPIEKGKQAILK